METKAGRLQEECAFRVPTDRKTWEIYARLKGANVESGDKSFPVKTVLPVPAGSADVDVDDSGPGQGRRAKQN